MTELISNNKNIRSLRKFFLLDNEGRKIKKGKIIYKNKLLHNFSSNDYLGLSQDKDLIKKSINWTKKFGVGFSSSRLVTGNIDETMQIENKLSKNKNKEDSIILGSGFQCNSTLIPSLLNNTLGKRCKAVIFSDRLNHSSIYHGCYLSKQKVKRYNHLDFNHLEYLLKKEKNIKLKMIISETVFSMDGDIADIQVLRFLAKKYNCILYFDEAHAVGIFGPRGFGLTTDKKNSLENEVVVGTCSKAFGSYGSYISCSKEIKKKIINTCAGLIYSTAIPPGIIGSIDVAIDKVKKMKNVRKKLLQNSNFLKKALLKNNFNIPNTNSQIIPIILNQNKISFHASNLLIENGFFVVPIFPPTVPARSSRLRVSLTSLISRKQIISFINIINNLNIKQ